MFQQKQKFVTYTNCKKSKHYMQLLNDLCNIYRLQKPNCAAKYAKNQDMQLNFYLLGKKQQLIFKKYQQETKQHQHHHHQWEEKRQQKVR